MNEPCLMKQLYDAWTVLIRKGSPWLSCLFFLLCFASCHHENEGPDIDEDGRVVLVYMAADNSLGGPLKIDFAMADYGEMKQGMLSVSESDRLLVYMDKVYKSGVDDEMWQNPVLVELSHRNGKVQEKVIKRYAERNSVGLEETREVFRDAFSYASNAGSFGLVYWSHCDGWLPYGTSSSASTRWIGQDTGSGDKRMNLADFVTVLQEEAPHLDFILFDACFMQSVEVAYELRSFADYYLASPTETPGPGAPYDRIVPEMFVEGGVLRMAKAYYDHYRELYTGVDPMETGPWTGGVAITVMDCRQLEALASVTRQCLAQVAPPDRTSLRRQVFNYDRRYSYGTVDYFDMAGLMQQLLDDALYARWKTAFEAARIGWYTTEKSYSSFSGMFSMEGTQGVTHYIPPVSISSQTLSAYRALSWYQAAGLDQLEW